VRHQFGLGVDRYDSKRKGVAARKGQVDVVGNRVGTVVGFALALEWRLVVECPVGQ
jgi:hypothetical protein